MPSLFMWKASSPLTSSISLSYYSGSNWFLEEHSTYSKSALYLNQQSLSNHGWIYDIKWMPTNWVGSHLLENVSIPYALIKEDTLGRLEQLDDWMRFTTYREVDDKEAEWERIQKWITEKSVTNTLSTVRTKVYPDTSYEPCLINLSAGHSPVSHENDNRPNKNYQQIRYSQHHPQHHPHHPRKHPYQKKRIVA